MKTVLNEQLDEKPYASFWSKLQQSKFDIIYYSAHFNRCTTVTRAIKYAIIGVTTLATGVWMTWSDISTLCNICAIVIVLLQVVSAVSERFPYETRKLELREMLAELESLYITMENDWRSISGLKISNERMQELILFYDQKQAEIKQHYFKDDSLPEREKLRIKADERTEEYFKYFV